MQFPAHDQGRTSSQWNHEMRASDELFKMLVIKLELVIKIKTRANMKAGAYAQEVNVPGNERPGKEREWTDGPKKLKGKSHKCKQRKKERYRSD